MLILVVGILVTLGSAMAFYNFFTAPQLKKGKPKEYPLVSVLIPARNEERNIANCLDSLENQTYHNYEVLVLDDNSEDKTSEIVSKYDKVKLFSGKELPKRWTGKNWAMHQLTKRAKGDLFLMIDADVTIDKHTISSAVAMFQKKKVNMLTVFPKQVMKSFGEWLVVPIIDWLMMSFIPMNLVYLTKGSTVTIAIGQFILMDKKTYNKIGGHEAIASVNVEDVEMARQVKTIGKKVIALRSTGNVVCHMYEGFFASVDGVSRNFYRGAHMPPVTYVIGLISLFMALIIPFIFVWFDFGYFYLLLPIFTARFLLSIISRQNPIINVILLSVHSIMTMVVAINSMYVSLTNKIVWKGRLLPKME